MALKSVVENHIFGECCRPFENTSEETAALINVLSVFNQNFVIGTDIRELFDRLLLNFLNLTESEYGFIGERLITKKGDPYLKTQAQTNIAWNEETRRFYDENAPTGLEFFNLETLFGRVVVSGEPLISNDPANDPRRGGLPEGHPDLNAFLGIPLYMGDRYVGMAGIANRPGGYDAAIVQYLAPLVSLTSSMIEAVRMESIAHFDPLTGLHNRRIFEKYFVTENSRHIREKTEYSILILDIDHFKSVNDTYGHNVGDQCLIKIAEIMNENIRGGDILARFGGEEFILLLPNTPLNQAGQVAEKLRTSIQEVSIETPDGDAKICLTVSIGGVSVLAERSIALEALIEKADKALYRAKENGRNQVCF